MAPSSYKSVRLDRAQALKRIRTIMSASGTVHFSRHALDRMEERRITTGDVDNVLRSEHATIRMEPEYDAARDAYKYRLETNAMGIVVGFDNSGESLVVVTVIRFRV